MKTITNFQKRVYKIVKKISKGKTKSYKEIASELKTSPRAVGKALNTNPFFVRIPCHRVIRSNGKIGGYKLGVKKKKELLKKEGVKLKGQFVQREV